MCGIVGLSSGSGSSPPRDRSGIPGRHRQVLRPHAFSRRPQPPDHRRSVSENLPCEVRPGRGVPAVVSWHIQWMGSPGEGPYEKRAPSLWGGQSPGHQKSRRQGTDGSFLPPRGESGPLGSSVVREHRENRQSPPPRPGRRAPDPGKREPPSRQTADSPLLRRKHHHPLSVGSVCLLERGESGFSGNSE